MSENSILTPLSDFYMDLIFSSWSMINKGNNLYVSMCVMDPLKIKFKLTLGGVTIDPCMGSNVTHKIEMKNVIFQKNYLTKLLKTIIKRLR